MPDEGNATIADENRLCTNGIDGGTGQHLWQPVAVGEATAWIKGERQDPIQNANCTASVRAPHCVNEDRVTSPAEFSVQFRQGELHT